jgi:hypothetical protein
MKRAECAHEERVMEAIRSGQWAAALRQHADECEVCGEHRLVAEFLQKEAELAQWVAPVPDASVMWWKAHLATKQRAMKLATRPVQVARWLACAAGAAASIWFAAQGGMQTWAVTVTLPSGMASPYVLAGTAGCAVCLLIGSVYAVWSDR